MPIQPLTHGQLLKCAGKNPSTWRGERARQQTAVAFGAADVARHGFAMDAVAMMLVDELNGLGLNRKFAANIVRFYFDKWIEAVSRIEHKGENIVFVVYKLETDSEDRWNVALGHIKDDTIGDLPTGWRQMWPVKLARVMQRIQANAAEARINLTGTQFTLPLDHPVLVEWIAQHREAVKRAMAPTEDGKRFQSGVKQRRTFEAASCQLH